MCLLIISPVGLGGVAILSRFYIDLTSGVTQSNTSSGCAMSFSDESAIAVRYPHVLPEYRFLMDGQNVESDR